VRHLGFLGGLPKLVSRGYTVATLCFKEPLNNSKISDYSAIANRIGFTAAMDQMTFSGAEYQNKKRKTRCEIFLERMDKLSPWKHLEMNGSMLREDSIVDATIISAPSSTKNESSQRDPDVH